MAVTQLWPCQDAMTIRRLLEVKIVGFRGPFYEPTYQEIFTNRSQYGTNYHTDQTSAVQMKYRSFIHLLFW